MADDKSAIWLTLPDLEGKIYFDKDAVAELVQNNTESKVAVVQCKHIYPTNKKDQMPLLQKAFCLATISPGYVLSIQFSEGGYRHVHAEVLNETIAAMGSYL